MTLPNTNNPIERPSWLEPAVWPHEIRTAYIDGHPVAYTDEGHGPVLVLVHDGLNSYLWVHLISELADRFRVITLDFPGSGLTPGSQTTPDLAGDAALVGSFLDIVQLDRFTLAVHDLGGPVGLAVAAERPERVDGLVLINTFAWPPDSASLRAMLRTMGSRPMAALNSGTNFMARASSTRFGVGRHFDKTQKRAYINMFQRKESRQRFHSTMASASRDIGFLRGVEDSLGALSGKPVLTVFGKRNDPFRFQDRWLHHFPDADQMVVPGGYHFPMCDAPEQVARRIAEWHASKNVSRPAM